MPAPADIDNKIQQVYTWHYMCGLESCANATGSTLYMNIINDNFFNSFLNEDSENKAFEQVVSHNNYTNKQFLMYDRLLTMQYEKMSEHFAEIDFSEIRQKSSEVVSFLLDLSPSALSFELTGENSIFYTFKKDEFSFYIHYFFEKDEFDDYEATLIKYNDTQKLESISGDILFILYEVENHFFRDNDINIKLSYTHELSY